MIDEQEPGEHYPLPTSPVLPAPRAPTHSPRVRLTKKQMIGLPVLALIPILALLGVFGDRSKTLAVSSPSVGLTVDYPDRMRYRQSDVLRISIVNRADRVLDTVLVSLDTSYLSRFIGVHGVPAPSVQWVVPLTGVKPGDSRLVTVELTGDQYGAHPGMISAATGTERTTVTFSTFVFP
jgi:hypothetical protein